MGALCPGLQLLRLLSSLSSTSLCIALPVSRSRFVEELASGLPAMTPPPEVLIVAISFLRKEVL
jgi:hypothetical protein